MEEQPDRPEAPDQERGSEGETPTLERAPISSAALFRQAAPPAAPLERVGPYQILSLLGEGGFGLVYLAQQESPLRRRVALKVLKPGMDSAMVLARFEQERQALAMMDHPNVARVFDAGATDRGLPYFVMEYVRGEPITTYCDRNSLTIESRLILFRQVCEAVQHAHTKGVIHRDLKPSNILVEVIDDRAVPKVIDFGVAKAVSRELSERAVFTEIGLLIGTPEYMSPEQAEMGATDIDTRADVYSLGVVLYELLTGALPFDPRTLRAAGLAEIRRIIREVDPPRPSTRLASLGDGSREAARRRRTQTATLARALRGELEWIPLKAMRKDRLERYRSPIDLADDIGNYLAGRPLNAGPESAAYRARKFVRRNRGAVIAVSAVATSVLLGLAGTTIGLARAQAALRAEQDALAAQRAATAQAEAEADLSSSIESFLTDNLLTSVSPSRAGPDVTVRALLDASAPGVEGSFADRPLTEAGIRAALGRAYQSIGLLEEATPHLERAYRLFLRERGGADDRTIAAGLQYSILLWRNDKAGEALAVLDTLDAPELDAPMLQQANALKFAGRPDDAATLYDLVHSNRRNELGPSHPATLAVAYDIALNEEARRNYDEAERWFRETLDTVRAHLPPDSTLLGELLSEFARFLSSRRNDIVAAEPLYREAEAQMARTLGDDHWRVIQVRANLGRFLQRNGRFDEGRPFLERAAMQYAATDSERMRQGAPTVLEWLRQGLMDADAVQDAERMCAEIAAQMATTFGADDDSTARARLSLQRVRLVSTGGPEIEAETLAEARRLLRSSDRAARGAAITAAADVVAARTSRGDAAGARATAQEFLPAAEQMLGPEHPTSAALREAAAG